MALTYAEQYSLAYNATVRNQVEVAALREAHFVMDGGNGFSDATVLAHAKQAAVAPQLEVTKFVWYVATNVATMTPTDAQVQQVVDSKYLQIWGV